MKHLFFVVSLGAVFVSLSGCVVHEREYPRHHHHETIYEEPVVVEERVVTR